MANILIIDDEKAIRKTLTEILSYEGYKIDEAADGEEGLKRFGEKTYDVVLCDIKMPKLDGIEFLEKSREVNPDVPVIMISGHGNIDTAVEAVKKGAYDYISKPPDLNRLLITLRNALDKQSLVTETKVLKRKVGKALEMVGDPPTAVPVRRSQLRQQFVDEPDQPSLDGLQSLRFAGGHGMLVQTADLHGDPAIDHEVGHAVAVGFVDHRAKA